jgi:hypothetical protein
MKLSFMEEGWTPNYVTFKEAYLKEHESLGDMFLFYVEEFVKALKKENMVYISFDFGERKLELPCMEVEELLYDLKRNEGNPESDVNVIPKELADFFGYFNLIERTKKGYLMVEDYINKSGNASLATVLGHILIEKHFPANQK